MEVDCVRVESEPDICITLKNAIASLAFVVDVIFHRSYESDGRSYVLVLIFV